ncbi:MAG: hydroxyacylglutathione hydrolase [Ferrovibrio sp.]|nr:hydroxyacylglutathione hydrolase [Ferrovibrio sp.]
MMTLEIVQIPVLNDNYVYLLRDNASGKTAVVDPAVPEPVLAALQQRGWKLDVVLNTHHHGDHVGGNLALQAATGCAIVGPRAEAPRIPGIALQLGEGDSYALGDSVAQVFDVPGHTAGHIAYWFKAAGALFCGDTLFALGCGRLFEGTAAQMWTSLSKFLSLPDATRIYCAHEYTESNARFAVTVEPGNGALLARYDAIKATRAKGLPTVPSTLGEERATNPFLRPMSANLRATLGLESADDVAVFAETRKRKDGFRG